MTIRRERLLASGLALTALIVWLQVFLPVMAPVDPRNPSRHLLGDTAIICTIEGMKIVKLSDLPLEQDGKAGKMAGIGNNACPLCAAHSLAGAALLPIAIDFRAPAAMPSVGAVFVSIQPRAPPPTAGFTARAPPQHA